MLISLSSKSLKCPIYFTSADSSLKFSISDRLSSCIDLSGCSCGRGIFFSLLNRPRTCDLICGISSFSFWLVWKDRELDLWMLFIGCVVGSCRLCVGAFEKRILWRIKYRKIWIFKNQATNGLLYAQWSRPTPHCRLSAPKTHPKKRHLTWYNKRWEQFLAVVCLEFDGCRPVA